MNLWLRNFWSESVTQYSRCCVVIAPSSLANLLAYFWVALNTWNHSNPFTHTQMQILLQLLAVMCTWQSQVACALSRHCEPYKQSSWSWATNSQENRPFLTASVWCGHPKSHLDHCCFMRKGLEFAPQQMPGTQSQLWWGWWEADGKPHGKVAWVGLRTSGPLTQGHNHYTTQPLHTHTHTNIMSVVIKWNPFYNI